MRGLVLFGLALVTAGSASAQDAASPTGISDRVVACRSIADPAQRLSCYDEAVGAFAQAQQSGDMVVVDREQVRRTNRSLFGLSLPDMGSFGSETDRVAEQTYAIRSAERSAYGGWVLQMQDGTVWRQTDDRRIPRPRDGASAHVERGRLGGYTMSINGAASIRVERSQ